MSDILEEFEQYISSNKELLNVLPTNTIKNRAKYVEKVDELLEGAQQTNKAILNTIQDRYESIVDTIENPKIGELTKSIDSIKDIELFNELNTPYEKLGLDKINHRLDRFFEGNLDLVNKNIKLFLKTFEDFGIRLTVDDFNYSQYVHDYMRVFFSETSDGSLNSEALSNTFESIYWKCPTIVTHIELNMRHLYNLNAKKFEKELKDRNTNTLSYMNLDKNGLVKRYFELNKDLIELKRIDTKSIIDKFVSGEWKAKNFSEKEMSTLYSKLCLVDYNSLNEDAKNELNDNFTKLLNTLQEYNTYKKYKYILDDLKARSKNKENLKTEYYNKQKELRKKEQAFLKENDKYNKIKKIIDNPIFIFIRKKLKRKIYEFPANSTNQIKEIERLYQDLDSEEVNLRIADYVDDNCSIKYTLKIATSFYAYSYNMIQTHYKKDPDIDVEKELQELVDFIDQPYKVMLNNIKLIEEPNIVSIISNRYKILNINVQEDVLTDNLEDLIKDVERIVDYSDIRKSGIRISDIDFIENAKQILLKKM